MILYIAIFSVFLSVLVAVKNWKINRASIFLSVLIFLQSVFLLHQHSVTDGGSIFWMAVMYNNFSYTYYLAGPLILWYTRSLINDEIRLTKFDLLHLAPFVLNFIGVIPYILTPFEYKLQVAEALLKDLRYAEVIQQEINWVFPMKLNALARNISLLSYSVYSIAQFTHYLLKSKGVNDSLKYQGKHLALWYFIFTGVFFLIGANNMTAAVRFTFFGGTAVTLYEFNVAFFNSLLIAGMPLVLITFPHIIYGLPKPVSKASKSPGLKEENKPAEITGDESIYFKKIAELISILLEKEKPHLKVDFSIEDLMARLDVPRHHLYFCLNSVIGTKFTELKNRHRILHAQHLLLNLDLNRFTIDSIGLQSGFSSRSNFYSSFKDITGITPSEFLKQNEKKANGE